MRPAVFAAIFAALYAAHQVADHWVQTQHQADTKGQPGWPGRRACADHVASYTATSIFALYLVAWRTGIHLDDMRVGAGLAVSAVSHYLADRRTPLARLAGWLGSGRFYQLGAPRPGRDDNPSLGTGAYALDQSWHITWLLATALIITG